jgi:hypothetical protein
MGYIVIDENTEHCHGTKATPIRSHIGHSPESQP